MRALIAEDDNDFRTILTNLLVSLGVSVREAETAEQALAHFREESGAFDVLFTDLRMPGMGGLELMRLIRRAAPDLPMVVITGHANLDFALESIRLQVAGFLKKPFTVEELEELVQQINGRQPPTVARDSPPSEFWRTQLVRVLTLSVECWRLATGKDKSALATESGLWRVHFDKSTPRTRTLDKYLRLDTLPQHPQREAVLHTARFVLDRAPLSPLQLELEAELHKLEALLQHLGRSGRGNLSGDQRLSLVGN